MKIFTIVIERYHYSAQTSIGKMYFEYIKDFVQKPLNTVTEYFGYTLEDTARPDNIKVMKETCLPGGLECDVSLYESSHFGKTIIFHTREDKKTINYKLLKWVYCLAHGGNDHGDTAGCVLVARNKGENEWNHIQGSLKDELRAIVEQKIAEGYTIKAKFINLIQTS